MKEYNKTDQQIHWLCQIIAKANRTFVPKNEDDSYTNIFFDALGDRITGRWIETESEKYLLALGLSNLHFEWLNSSMEVVQSHSSVGKLAVDIEKEISGVIRELGLNPEGFTEKLHFEIPNYPFAGEKVEEISSYNLDQWRYYRKLANEVCAAVLGYLQLDGEIRIWPHHFDTGSYVVVKERIGLGFGFAMEDTMAGSPYFYIAGYPKKGTVVLENLPALSKGRWETEGGWKGAILPISENSHLGKSESEVVISEYLKAAINWYMAQ